MYLAHGLEDLILLQRQISSNWATYTIQLQSKFQHSILEIFKKWFYNVYEKVKELEWSKQFVKRTNLKDLSTWFKTVCKAALRQWDGHSRWPRVKAPHSRCRATSSVRGDLRSHTLRGAARKVKNEKHWDIGNKTDL